MDSITPRELKEIALSFVAFACLVGCGDAMMMTVGMTSTTDPTEPTGPGTTTSSTTEVTTGADQTTSTESSDSSGSQTSTTTAGTSDTSVGECGDGVVDEDEECEPAQSSNCNDACLLDRWVFISEPYTSGFNGILNIDNHCLAGAIDAGLLPPDTSPLDFAVKAWVSSSSEWPAQNFEHHAGRYVLVGDDAPIVAEDWESIVSGQIAHPIDRNALGTTIALDFVATNTKTDGTPVSDLADEMCDDWSWDTLSLPPPSVVVGESDKNDSKWTDAFLGSCGAEPRFYCFQQGIAN